jgi:hypothetical protein
MLQVFPSLLAVPRKWTMSFLSHLRSSRVNQVLIPVCNKLEITIKLKLNKFRSLSLRVNYTDRATAAYRIS